MRGSNLSFFQNCDEIHFLNPNPAVPANPNPSDDVSPPNPDGPVIVIDDGGGHDDEKDETPQGYEPGNKSETWKGQCKLDSIINTGSYPSTLIFNANASAALTVDTPNIDESGAFKYYQQENNGRGLLFYDKDTSVRSDEAMSCHRLANSIVCNRGDKFATRILSCQFTGLAQ